MSPLDGLRTRLMEPSLYDEFCREYTRSFNSLQMEKTQARAAKEAELERNRRRVKQMVNAIADGMPALPMKDEMIALEARREVLEAELATFEEPVPMLHPSLAIRYREELEKLHVGLTSEENRHEAFDVIRGLIERVVIQPQEDGYSVALEGDLCAILNLAGDNDLCRVLPLSGVTMVAEDRFIRGSIGGGLSLSDRPSHTFYAFGPVPRRRARANSLTRLSS